jgi:LysM repeat protein
MKRSAWKILVVLILVSYVITVGLAWPEGGPGSPSATRGAPSSATRTPRPTFTAVEPAAVAARVLPTHTSPPTSGAEPQGEVWTPVPPATETATTLPTPAERSTATETPRAPQVLGSATDLPQPTATPTPTPTATALIHIVKAGENLSTIAARYGTTVDAIVAANKLRNPDLILIDQVLILPPPAQVTPTATASQ